MIIYCKYHFALVSIELLELIFLGNFDEGGLTAVPLSLSFGYNSTDLCVGSCWLGLRAFSRLALPTVPDPLSREARTSLSAAVPKKENQRITPTRLPENANKSQNCVLSFFYNKTTEDVG